MENMSVLVFSIVIDSDRGAFKKSQFTLKIERLTYIWMFMYVMIFKLPEMAKNEILDFSGTIPVWVKVISSSILYVNLVLEKFQG